MIDTIPAVASREPGPWARLSPRVRRAAVAGAAVLLVAVVLRVFVVQVVVVEGGSMEPTLAPGSRVWVTKRGVRPARGDVVVFDAPAGSGATHGELVKRVIATAGERVALRACIVFVDGVALDEPYRYPERECGAADLAELTVPTGSVFVLGDHRSASLDSRAFGPVPSDAVHGRVRGPVWPF